MCKCMEKVAPFVPTDGFSRSGGGQSSLRAMFGTPSMATATSINQNSASLAPSPESIDADSSLSAQYEAALQEGADPGNIYGYTARRSISRVSDASGNRLVVRSRIITRKRIVPFRSGPR